MVEGRRGGREDAVTVACLSGLRRQLKRKTRRIVPQYCRAGESNGENGRKVAEQKEVVRCALTDARVLSFR